MAKELAFDPIIRPQEERVREAYLPSEDEQRFVAGLYALYEQFREGNREYRAEIRADREVRALKDGALDQETSRTGVKTPQLNTLNSTIDNMVADFSDNIPEAVMVPETPEQIDTADDMTDVVRWILYHAGFENAWLHGVEDVAVTGTAVMQVYWDDYMDCGGQQGGIRIDLWDAEDWLPDPVYADFQLGRAVFKVCVHPMSWFEQHYPDKAPYIEPDAASRMDAEDVNDAQSYRFDDPLVALIECWYRRYDAQTHRSAIHKAEIAGGVLLYNSREEHPNGVYEHGMYPFVTLRFRESKDTAYGTGAVYEYADVQRMINRYARYIDENARASAKLKLLINKNCNMDKAQIADFNQDVVEGDIVDDTAVRWFQAAPLNSSVFTMLQFLQDTEKQDSGQNQFSRGEGGMGVTAASAIEALQQAGGKISRMHTTLYWLSFQSLVEQVMALAGEFFTEERMIMITGRDPGGPLKVVEMTNKKIRGGRNPFEKPGYTVRVEIQQNNPQEVSTFNQLLLQMDQNSAAKEMPIPPYRLAQALRGIPGKPELIKILQEADTQQQMLQQLQQAVAQLQAQNQQMQGQLQQTGEEMLAQKQLLQKQAQQMRGETIPNATENAVQGAAIAGQGIDSSAPPIPVPEEGA